MTKYFISYTYWKEGSQGWATSEVSYQENTNFFIDEDFHALTDSLAKAAGTPSSNVVILNVIKLPI